MLRVRPLFFVSMTAHVSLNVSTVSATVSLKFGKCGRQCVPESVLGGVTVREKTVENAALL